ncbi:MAG: magnesium/cobalt transporter CorA [Fimbriimonadaceae bacterium]|nr:magnesium/cobalt transporter CorA [Fimbriimonadaceae bacterium]
MADEAQSLSSSVPVVAYGPKGVIVKEAGSVSEVIELLADHTVTWIDLSLDTSAEWLPLIGQQLGLHMLGIEDALTSNQRAKLEEFNGHVLFQLNVYELRSDGKDELENFAFFLGERFLLTVQPTREDSWDGLRAKVRDPHAMLRSRGPDYLAAMLVHSLVDCLYPVVEDLSDTASRLEDTLIQGPNRVALGHIHEVRNTLADLRRCTWPSRDVVRTLAFTETAYVEERTRKYFRDSHDLLALIIDMSEVLRERVAPLNDLYLTAMAFKQNEVLKVLTVASVIFMPLTFIVGVYGMNFNTEVSGWNMPELNHPYGYVWVCAVMLAISAALLGYFWKKGWLKVN